MADGDQTHVVEVHATDADKNDQVGSTLVLYVGAHFESISCGFYEMKNKNWDFTFCTFKLNTGACVRVAVLLV